MAENNRIIGSEEPKIEAGAEDELPAEVPPAPSAGNEASPPEMKNVQDLTRFVELLLQQMQDRFQSISDQVLSRIDEMSNRIDDLERNIADLVTQSGAEGAGK